MKNKSLFVELKNQFHRDNHAFFILSVIGALLSGFLGMTISWITGELIDTASGTGSLLPINILPNQEQVHSGRNNSS